MIERSILDVLLVGLLIGVVCGREALYDRDPVRCGPWQPRHAVCQALVRRGLGRGSAAALLLVAFARPRRPAAARFSRRIWPIN